MSAFLLPTHKVLAKVFRQKKCRCILPKSLSKCRQRGRPRRQKQDVHPSFLTPFPLMQTSEKKRKTSLLRGRSHRVPPASTTTTPGATTAASPLGAASRAPLPGTARSRCRRLAPGAAAAADARPNRRLPIPPAPKLSLAGAPQPTALAPAGESNGRRRPNPQLPQPAIAQACRPQARRRPSLPLASKSGAAVASPFLSASRCVFSGSPSSHPHSLEC